MNVSDQVSIDMNTFNGETVEVTIRKETRRLECKKYPLGEGREMVCVYGTAGRYSTGSKDWPATLEPMIDRAMVNPGSTPALASKAARASTANARPSSSSNPTRAERPSPEARGVRPCP